MTATNSHRTNLINRIQVIENEMILKSIDNLLNSIDSLLISSDPQQQPLAAPSLKETINQENTVMGNSDSHLREQMEELDRQWLNFW